jgi:hypothetical protein
MFCADNKKYYDAIDNPQDVFNTSRFQVDSLRRVRGHIKQCYKYSCTKNQKNSYKGYHQKIQLSIKQKHGHGTNLKIRLDHMVQFQVANDL